MSVLVVSYSQGFVNNLKLTCAKIGIVNKLKKT